GSGSGNLQKAAHPGEWRRNVCHGSRTNAWNHPDAIERLTIETMQVVGRGILTWWEAETSKQHVLRIEPPIDVHELHERSHEQSGTQEQHDRERDLSDDETAAHARLRPGRAATLAVTYAGHEIP